MEVRFAVESDWPMLVEFYLRVYRPHHPLHSKEFWMWRFGDPENGSSVIAESNGSIVGTWDAASGGNDATITYVGGGFNRAGIHNILEAAAYGKTVVFGPNYSKSNEANEMIALSLAHSFSAISFRQKK